MWAICIWTFEYAYGHMDMWMHVYLDIRICGYMYIEREISIYIYDIYIYMFYFVFLQRLCLFKWTVPYSGSLLWLPVVDQAVFAAWILKSAGEALALEKFEQFSQGRLLDLASPGLTKSSPKDPKQVFWMFRLRCDRLILLNNTVV